ncbi:MAG: cupin domain-containing protein [Actinomycetota bacterium]|nr:cupin domain-containing protein [Actinomycetota bacterium]
MRIISEQSITSTPADPAQFTGRVWRTDFISPADARGLAGVRFLYEPGARSFWHVHECEQAIIAVVGSGLVFWEGLDTARSLQAGDWWHVEPGVAHWHGAGPATLFAHLAVTAGGKTTWLRAVSDADYQRRPGHRAAT